MTREILKRLKAGLTAFAVMVGLCLAIWLFVGLLGWLSSLGVPNVVLYVLIVATIAGVMAAVTVD